MKKIIFVIVLLVIAVIILQSCKKKLEDPIPATSSTKDKDWAVDPDFTGEVSTLTKEKEPIDSTINTLNILSGYDPGFTSTITTGKYKPVYPPETFVESIVGLYEVYLDHEVYSCEIVQIDAVNFIIKNFNNSITLPVQNVQGTTTFRQPEYNADYRIYAINPTYSYWDIDGSITIQAYVNRRYLTVKMYRSV